MTVKLLSNPKSITKTGSNNDYAGKPVAETIINGFFTVDHKWTVKYWNKAAEKLLMVPAGEIVGKNLWEKFGGIIPINFYKVYNKAFLKDIPLHFVEYWVEMGAWFDVITYYDNETLSVSFKSSNQPANPKHAVHPKLQLKSLNELYRLVTEVTNDCLWEWDLGAKELFWIDGGHKRAFGYQIENALIPQSFWESRVHPDDRRRVLEKLNKIITGGTGTLWEDEYRFKSADGGYAYVHDRGHIIYNRGHASRMIGATQDISERVLLEKKLAGERLRRQKEITEAVLTAQENEREQIGKELHDNLNQILAVANLYIQMAKKEVENREIYLDKSSGYIVDVIEEIRKISKNLAIPGMHGTGLFDTIKNLLRDLVVVHPVKIEFQEGNLGEDDLDEKLQLAIFRIVQEQLNNILKYASASYATINLSKHKNEIILIISDNGRGCDITKEKKGVGIINIRSRAELFNGRVTIVSKPGEGYQLKVVFPLDTVPG